MNAGVMEGLVGANSNMKILNVPMRVYHEAERKGDTAKMERAMGYAADFAGRATAYKDMAEEELKKEIGRFGESYGIDAEKMIEMFQEEDKSALEEDMLVRAALKLIEESANEVEKAE